MPAALITPAIDFTLPAYEPDDAQPLPLYSSEAGSSECLLPTEPQELTGCPTCEWIYTSKYLKFNLGRKLWKLSSPTYGLNGTIEGTIQFMESDSIYLVESLQITLEGCLRRTASATTETDVDTFLSHSINVKVNPSASEFDFSFGIPSHFARYNQQVSCPPSFFFSEGTSMLEVVYSLRFNATFRSTKLKRRTKTECRTIGIFYLPKNAPTFEPMTSLPPASRHCENPPLFLAGSHRLSSVPVLPSFPNASNKRQSDFQVSRCLELAHSVYFSIPSPATFTAGQTIPFMLSLSFPHEPYVAEMYCGNVAIHLYKRVGFSAAPSSKLHSNEAIERNELVSSASIRKNSGWTEGMVVLKGEIKAGLPGSEESWSIPNAAHVKYILRISLRPPASFSSQIPTYIHEEEITICTSTQGYLQREVLWGAGSTTPALGLSKYLRPLH